MKYELGMIGGGNMAEAIVRAAVEHGVVEPDRIIVCDPVSQRRDLFESIGVATTDQNDKAAANAVQVMLAVKPQVAPMIVGDLTGLDVNKQVVVSIMAGLTTSKIASLIGLPVRVVRVMPNTPLLVGCGMSAICLGIHARPGDELMALQLFRAAGEAVMVDESHMDAVTAVSGSGPAYVFYLAEAMADAAKSLGLPEELGPLLARQTVYGAAKLMHQSQEPPAELRRRVTSPGGTTQAAIEHMEAMQIATHLINAMRRAAERSRELGA